MEIKNAQHAATVISGFDKRKQTLLVAGLKEIYPGRSAAEIRRMLAIFVAQNGGK